MAQREAASPHAHVQDIGAPDIQLYALNKRPYGRLDSKAIGLDEGVIFLTYSSLIA